ncbi:8741_t:CDS:2 [Ambispora gerdemannii]|uniref:Probable quinone oxidoreductase n=1 Tax=Ambispora gerdemannii TaxID=144530 RepID=A0A9N9FN96_9GLOM|nr:8741_t:CDS:2 [Ambispora gerdemannii]
MATMKAIQIQRHGGTEVLEYVDLPRPEVTGNKILVKNHAIGVNFIDIYHRTGLYKVSLPFILGHEGAGVVEFIGEGVTDFAPGDQVVYMASDCYAEYTLVPSSHAFKIPANIKFKEAAAFLLQGLTCWTLVTQSYAVQKGDYVLIHAAAGGCGLLLTQLSKLLGAHVIGTTSNAQKAELAKKAGAEYVINYTTENVVEKVNEITNGLGVHVVYDGVGKDTFEVSLAAARRLGTVISFGNASGLVPPFTIARLADKNLRLMRPSLMNYVTTKEEFQKYTKELFDLIQENKISLLNVQVHKLSDAKKAHEYLESRKTTGKLILELV